MLETSAWPGEPVTLAGITKVRVEVVRAQQVAISACAITYVDDGKERCERYTSEIAPIARAGIPDMLRSGVIRKIERDSDTVFRTVILLAVIAAVLVLLALHAGRTRRALAPR